MASVSENRGRGRGRGKKKNQKKNGAVDRAYRPVGFYVCGCCWALNGGFFCGFGFRSGVFLCGGASGCGVRCWVELVPQTICVWDDQEREAFCPNFHNSGPGARLHFPNMIPENYSRECFGGPRGGKLKKHRWVAL